MFGVFPEQFGRFTPGIGGSQTGAPDGINARENAVFSTTGDRPNGNDRFPILPVRHENLVPTLAGWRAMLRPGTVTRGSSAMAV